MGTPALVWRSDQPWALLDLVPLRHTAGRDRAALGSPMIDAPARPIAYTERLGRSNVQSVPCGIPLSGRIWQDLGNTGVEHARPVSDVSPAPLDLAAEG